MLPDLVREIGDQQILRDGIGDALHGGDGAIRHPEIGEQHERRARRGDAARETEKERDGDRTIERAIHELPLPTGAAEPPRRDLHVRALRRKGREARTSARRRGLDDRPFINMTIFIGKSETLAKRMRRGGGPFRAPDRADRLSADRRAAFRGGRRRLRRDRSRPPGCMSDGSKRRVTSATPCRNRRVISRLQAERQPRASASTPPS